MAYAHDQKTQTKINHCTSTVYHIIFWSRSIHFYCTWLLHLLHCLHSTSHASVPEDWKFFFMSLWVLNFILLLSVSLLAQRLHRYIHNGAKFLLPCMLIRVKKRRKRKWEDYFCFWKKLFCPSVTNYFPLPYPAIQTFRKYLSKLIQRQVLSIPLTLLLTPTALDQVKIRKKSIACSAPVRCTQKKRISNQSAWVKNIKMLD